MNVYLRQLLLLAGLTLFGLGVYLLLFWVRAGSSITILFYRGITLAIASALITGLLALWLGRRTKDNTLPIASAALCLSFNICFLVLLPVTVDRSISVYLLSTIERQNDGIDPSALQRAFIDGYVVRMGAIDRRIGEQRKSGNVVVGADGKVRLTAQGHRFMTLSRIVARLFGTDPHLVNAPALAGNDARPRR